MINIDEINDEIKALEQAGCTNYTVCNKLAILYIIRDHYKEDAGAGASTMKVTPDNDLSKMSMRAM